MGLLVYSYSRSQYKNANEQDETTCCSLAGWYYLQDNEQFAVLVFLMFSVVKRLWYQYCISWLLYRTNIFPHDKIIG